MQMLVQKQQTQAEKKKHPRNLGRPAHRRVLNAPSYANFPTPNPATRRLEAGGNKRRKENLQTILTAWQQNLLAKHYPGRFQSPFVAGMDQIS